MNTQIPHSQTLLSPPPLDCSIVYFDGICGFCNGVVNFLMNRDHRGNLRYAPLQGETAKAQLAPADIQQLNSLVFTHSGRTYRRSAAAVRILWQLGPFWRLLGGLLWLIPLPVRDLGYGLLAKYRYQLFGKRESCRMPSPEERDRFLP